MISGGELISLRGMVLSIVERMVMRSKAQPASILVRGLNSELRSNSIFGYKSIIFSTTNTNAGTNTRPMDSISLGELFTHLVKAKDIKENFEIFVPDLRSEFRNFEIRFG